MFEEMQNHHNCQRISFIIIVVLVALLIFFVVVKPAKTEEVATIKDGHLIISESKQLADIPNVPKELWKDPEIAVKIYRSEIGEKIVNEKEIKNVRLAFPLPIVQTTIVNKKVSFVQGNWKVEDLPPLITKKTNKFFLFFGIFIPCIGILVVSITNLCCERKAWMLFVFFVVVLVSLFLSQAVCAVSGRSDGVSVLFAFLLIAVVFFGNYFAGGNKNGSPLALASFVGVVVCFLLYISSFGYVYDSNEIYWASIWFFAVWEVICFSIACVIAFYFKPRLC
jgi:hypothetical protein